MIKLTKQNLIYSIISLIFTTITVSTIFSLIVAIKKYNVNHNTKIINNNQQPYKYLVKDIGGKINIFENNSTKPKMILEKPTIFLPEFDRKLLSNGIYINNTNELNNLIEDYSD